MLTDAQEKPTWLLRTSFIQRISSILDDPCYGSGAAGAWLLGSVFFKHVCVLRFAVITAHLPSSVSRASVPAADFTGLPGIWRVHGTAQLPKLLPL